MKTEATSLMGMPYKKITAGLQRLQSLGVTPDRWLRMINAGIWATRDIVSSFVGSYEPADIRRLLGVQCEDFSCWSTDSIFQEQDNDIRQGFEMTLHYGGWTAEDLRKTPAGQRHMRDDDTYDKYLIKPEIGCYKVEFGYRMSYCRKISGYRDNEWGKTPGIIAMTALLIHLVQGGKFYPHGNTWYGAEKQVQTAFFHKNLGRDALCFYIEPPL